METTQEKKKAMKVMVKKMKEWMWAVIVVGALAGGVVWLLSLPKIPQSEVISRTGIHIHANISILEDGTPIVIPGNIGIEGSAVHKGIHTHDETGLVHVEKGGLVRKSDTTLAKFFEIWGQSFSKDALLGRTSGGAVTLLVNGVEQSAYETYEIKDGDNIVIEWKSNK